jgi:P pilus assembly chaperone PapD
MLFFVRKWKLYLYLNGVCIKKIRINVNEAPKDNVYVINVWFKKQFFNSNKVKVIVRPTKLIYTDEKKKETHWEFEYEEGIDI